MYSISRFDDPSILVAPAAAAFLMSIAGISPAAGKNRWRGREIGMTVD
jgi:hypothetical protein